MASLTLLVSLIAVVLVSCSGYDYEWQIGDGNQLQVRRNGSAWGSVCDDRFDDSTAIAVCGFMGYDNHNATSWTRAYRTINNIDIHLDELRCPSNATDFSQCTANDWGVEDCGHSEDVVLVCEEQEYYNYEWQLGDGNQLQVRRNGSAWGSVCDDRFDNSTATAVCGFMGYDNATSWTRAYPRTINNIDIHLDNFRCPSNATDFSQCAANDWGVEDCGHTEDVVLVCEEQEYYNYEWQLGDGNQLQVRRNGSAWGSVCDDRFDDSTAIAVCGFMGYDNATSWTRAYPRTINNIDIHLDNFRCPSNATDFSQCTANDWGVEDCRHTEDVVLVCEGSPEVGLYRAEQSSTLAGPDVGGGAASAIDNDYSTWARTNQESNPWLRVYFNGMYDVERVVMTQYYPPVQCTYKVSVYNGTVETVCRSYIKLGRGFETEMVECRGIRGDSVRLEVSGCGKRITMQEMKVYGTLEDYTPPTAPPTNPPTRRTNPPTRRTHPPTRRTNPPTNPPTSNGEGKVRVKFGGVEVNVNIPEGQWMIHG